MVTEAYFIDPVLLGWGEANWVAPEGPTDFKHLPPKMDLPLLLHVPDDHACVLGNRRQRLGIAAQTRLIPTGGHRQRQRLMRAVMIIDLAPPIEGLLQMRRIAPLSLMQDFACQTAMEAFIFAHRLRMIGPTVTDAHPDPKRSQTVKTVYD
jgi:hypothetical protein